MTSMRPKPDAYRQMTVEQVTNRVSLFSNYRLSVCIILAGAVAFVLFLVILAVSAVQFALQKRREA